MRQGYAEEIQELPVSDRLRLAINVLDFMPALGASGDLMLHPINLFVTKDAQVKIAYRGVPGMMVPRKWDQNLCVSQVLCGHSLGLGFHGGSSRHARTEDHQISWWKL